MNEIHMTKTYAEMMLDKVDFYLPAEEEYVAKQTLLPEFEQKLIDEHICPTCGEQFLFECKACGLCAYPQERQDPRL